MSTVQFTSDGVSTLHRTNSGRRNSGGGIASNNNNAIPQSVSASVPTTTAANPLATQQEKDANGNFDGVDIVTSNTAVAHQSRRRGTAQPASRGKFVGSFSLQAIIVIACALFAFVTSIVSFYVQYNFFVAEYTSQMKSRMTFYTSMYGNQVSVVSNSNASAISHICSSALFDVYDNVLNPNPSTNMTDYMWYTQHVQAMFALGTPVTFTFPLTGNSITMVSGEATANITINNGTHFVETAWAVNASLAPWYPISSPRLATDRRVTNADVKKIMTNGTAYSAPMIGLSTPENGFQFNGAALDESGNIMFIVSVSLKAATIVEWGNVVPNGEAYYFNDDGQLMASTQYGLLIRNGSLPGNIANKYVNYLAGALQGLLIPQNKNLRYVAFEKAFNGFAWGFHELPLSTLTGNVWRLLLIDTTPSTLTGDRPIINGACLIAGVTIGSLIICSLLFRVWFAPLSDLASRVRAAGKELDTTPMSFTLFTEISRAQEAFINVQESLQEIQSYIPQTLQPRSRPVVRPSSAGGTPTDVELVGNPIHRNSALNGNDGQASNSVGLDSDQRLVGDFLDDEPGSMTPCRMTTLHIKLHRFAKWELIAPLLEMAATVICKHDGVLDTVDYGSITATFNCHRACAQHEQCAVNAAVEIRKTAHSDRRLIEAMKEAPFTIGIDTDRAVALTVGFEDVRARVVVGSGFELARKLSSLAFDVLKCEVVITKPVAEAVSDVFNLIVDHVQPRTEHIQMISHTNSHERGATYDGKTVFEVLPDRPSFADSPAGDAILLTYRGAFEQMREGAYVQALERLTNLSEMNAQVDDTVRKHASRLWNICSARVSANRRERYVRMERCPWDVLPAEREIVNSVRRGAPAAATAASTGTSACTTQDAGMSAGGAAAGMPNAPQRPGVSTLSSYPGESTTLPPDPALYGGASIATEDWGRSNTTTT